MKYKNLLKNFGLAVILLTVGCKGEQSFIKVENINDVSSVKSNAVFYSLPKTALSVKIKAINEIEVRGPYASYSQKYIGTDDIITENSSKWVLESAEITTYPVKDSSRTFAIESNNPAVYSLNFSPEGFLQSINTKSDYKFTENSNGVFSANRNVGDEDINRNFEGLNINRYETVFDTVMHVVNADSIFTTVPTSKKLVIRKSLDEQAQELANQIFILRDDRNALLTGNSDGNALPSGDALKFMIEKLDEKERSLMSMFIGKTIKKERIYNFDFIPENRGRSQAILLKFSSQYGVQPQSSLRGNPIMIEIVSLNDNAAEVVYDENQQMYRRKAKTSSSKNSGFAYLTPAKAKVRILQNNDVIAEQIVNLSQMGLVRYIPAFLFEDKDFKAEFYPQSGTLKSLN